MAINALNSGAKVWLADLEDANTPHWTNVVSAARSTSSDAVRGTIAFTSPEGKEYALQATTSRTPSSSCGRAAGTSTSGT